MLHASALNMSIVFPFDCFFNLVFLVVWNILLFAVSFNNLGNEMSNFGNLTPQLEFVAVRHFSLYRNTLYSKLE
jgi:hypothetical protein